MISPNNRNLKILPGIVLTLILFVLQPFNSFYIYLANNYNISIQNLNLISQTEGWIWLVITYFYALKIEKQPLLLWVESQRSIGFYISSIFFILSIDFIGGVLIYYLMYHFGWYNIYNSLHTSNPTNISMKLLRVTTAAVVEEFIFRGYLMPRLQLIFKNNYLTILISATIFDLAHLSGGNIANTVFPLFDGLVFGYYYWKYKNIKTLIIYHFIIDLIFVLL